ncbi:MAG: branched-chain amino acid ABC transporter substrate-binding protein [Chloroflexota bacterium]
MRNTFRWSAVLTGMLLVLAACQPASSPGESTAESAAESAAASLDAAAVCAADELGCVEIPSGEPLHIVYWGVLSGADATLGEDSKRGVEIAIADIDNTLLGHDIQFTTEDGLCTPEGGATAAQKLAADTTIAGLIGPNCTDESLGGMQTLFDAGMTTVSSSATRAGLTVPDRPEEYAAFLRTAHSDYFQGRMVAEYLYNELGLTKLATVHDGSGYAEALAEVARTHFEELGGTITTDGSQAIAKTDTDMSAVLTAIAADPPDAIFFPVFIAGAGFLTDQAKDTPGLEDVVLMSADGTFSPDYIKAAGPAAVGQLISSPDTSQFTAAYQDFLAKHRAAYGGEPLSIFHAHAYDAATLVFAALEKVAVVGADGATFIPRTAYRDALYASTGVEGLTGPLNCNASGDCGAPILAVYEVTEREVQTPPVWPPEAPIWAPEPDFYTK